jgi:hypothetical protein
MEFVLCLFMVFFMLIWIPLFGEFFVGLVDLFLGGVVFETEDLIVIFSMGLRHLFYFDDGSNSILF